ncbi:hypothetical protein [Streptomyces sp. AC602_WCS936]|uniref:hypothetical protein n=1 Tax=Streptomyces sp. AC602_WCS936 TaxID=2823685 RepID=UPI0020B64D9F|nr:hypothetical protein [Streptomyces sp. AC602_WCS936]
MDTPTSWPGAPWTYRTREEVIDMTIRAIAHHLGLPVRRDPQQAAKIIEELRPVLNEVPQGDRRDWATAEMTRMVLTERHWHRPYLRG